jgi:hypothetical protein
MAADMKIVINTCLDVFLYRTRRSKSISVGNRDDPILVSIVEDLGDKANGRFAKLRIAMA